MSISDLLVDPDRRRMTASPQCDALTEDDALMECALLDLRMDVTTSSLWLLFDCRGALQFDDGNTAIVVVTNVASLKWDAELRGRRLWRSVMGWYPRAESGRLSVVVETEPGSRLEIEGDGGEFFVGDIPGGDEPPPDFTTDSDADIRNGLASWSSEFTLVGATFLTQE